MAPVGLVVRNPRQGISHHKYRRRWLEKKWLAGRCWEWPRGWGKLDAGRGEDIEERPDRPIQSARRHTGRVRVVVAQRGAFIAPAIRSAGVSVKTIGTERGHLRHGGVPGKGGKTVALLALCCRSDNRDAPLPGFSKKGFPWHPFRDRIPGTAGRFSGLCGAGDPGSGDPGQVWGGDVRKDEDGADGVGLGSFARHNTRRAAD